MSPVHREDAADPRVAWDDEAVRLLERLDADNEHYMLVTIELRDLLEDAVTREVALERRVDALLDENRELRAQVHRVEVELTALENTKLMRLSRPLRSVYGRWRGRRA